MVNCRDVLASFGHSLSEFVFAAACDDDVRAFRHESLRGRKPDPAAASGDDSALAF